MLFSIIKIGYECSYTFSNKQMVYYVYKRLRSNFKNIPIKVAKKAGLSLKNNFHVKTLKYLLIVLNQVTQYV